MQKQYTIVNSLLGKQVQALREERGWLIDRLASEAEVSQKTISRIENLKDNERRRFLTANLYRIAKALETPLEELLEYSLEDHDLMPFLSAPRFNHKAELACFLEDVCEAIRADIPFCLRHWASHENYFEMLRTEGLERLSQKIRKRGKIGRGYLESQSLIDRILLRRYLLSYRLADFYRLANAVEVEVPSDVADLLNTWNDRGEPYQSQMQLIQSLVEQSDCEGAFGSLVKDIRLRFVAHQPFVNVVTTVGLNHPLLRPAMTLVLASDETQKMTTARDILPFAQPIDRQFRQVAEGIQNATLLITNDGIRYWYRLDVFPSLAGNGTMGFDWQAAGGAIGWLVFLIEHSIDWNMPLLSVWGRYDAYRQQFYPVDGLREKLDACVEDGIRIVALPESTLEEPIQPGLPFKDYAVQRKVHLLPFPDDMPIFQVYPYIFERYQELALSSIGGAFDVEDAFHRSLKNQGELLQDVANNIYWVQGQKKYYIPTPDVITQMKFHGMQGWKAWRRVHSVYRVLGPEFYFKDSRSDGLLLRTAGPGVFLIENVQKRLLCDAYSFENYRHRGRLLEWRDIIWATEEIVHQEFPTGDPIQMTPILSVPANGATLTAPIVTLCCKPHPNRSWAYHIQIAENRGFTPLVDERTVSYPRWSISDLAPRAYFWRVRGVKHGRYPSDWSETWSFVVAPSA